MVQTRWCDKCKSNKDVNVIVIKIVDSKKEDTISFDLCKKDSKELLKIISRFMKFANEVKRE